MRRSKGFSLLEILIVIAILSVLIAIFGGYLSGFIQNQRLNEGASVLSESIRQASNQARVESRRIEVRVENDQVQWFTKSNNSLIKEEKIPHGVQLSPEQTFVFTGRGLPETALSFDASLKSKNRTVTLLPTGAVVLR